MKTFKEFVATNEHLSENVFDNIKNAATMYRLMTGIDKFPNFGPFKAPKIRAPLPTPKPTPVPTIKRASNPIAATLQAVSQLQGSTPQSGPAAERAKANREAQIQQRYGKAMNQTPSRFGKAGPDVPKPAGPDQGVGTKPRVAEPYTPPRPAASKVEPKVQPRSVTTERPSAPRPKPSGPITTAQAGDNVGTPKSAISTYRDKADTKGLSVGRYKTLAQHRAAVAAQKNKM
jgi:hypothetical protein